MVFVLFANEKRKGGQIFGKKFEEQTMTNPVKNYRARTPNNQPNPIDVFIGGRIRYFRKLRHVSQVELAGSVGTTFQQVQKYENGNNRVSGSRLWMISQVLQVPVSLFFEGINQRRGRLSLLPTDCSRCVKIFRKRRDEKKAAGAIKRASHKARGSS